MRYLKYFESSESKVDLIKDVFENIDLEYDVELKVSSRPDVYYTKSGDSDIKTNRTTKYYVYLKINGLIDDKFGGYLMNLIDKCESWAGLKLNMWIAHSSSRYSIDKGDLPNQLHSIYGTKHPNETIELRFMDIKINESMEEFDDELIRDYFNDFELDYDLTLHIKHDEDEFGKYYVIYFDLPKVTIEMVNDLRNSLTRVLNQENLDFESSVMSGRQVESINEFYREIYQWPFMENGESYIEIILKPRLN